MVQGSRTRHIRNEAKMILVTWLGAHPGRSYTTRELAYWTQLAYGYLRTRCPQFARYSVPLLKESVIRPGGKGRPVLAYALAGTYQHHTKHIRHYAAMGAQEYLAELSRQRVAALMRDNPGPDVGVPIELPKKAPAASSAGGLPERLQRMLIRYRNLVYSSPTVPVLREIAQLEAEAKRLGYVFTRRAR